MDCFAALATTEQAPSPISQTANRDPAARRARVLLDTLYPRKREGAGNAGCALHPRSRVPKICALAHTSIQVSGEHTDIPCAMALRLTSCSSRWSELVVTVGRQRTAADLAPAYAAPEPHDLTVRSPASPRGFAGRCPSNPPFEAQRLRLGA